MQDLVSQIESLNRAFHLYDQNNHVNGDLPENNPCNDYAELYGECGFSEVQCDDFLYNNGCRPCQERE